MEKSEENPPKMGVSKRHTRITASKPGEIGKCSIEEKDQDSASRIEDGTMDGMAAYLHFAILISNGLV